MRLSFSSRCKLVPMLLIALACRTAWPASAIPNQPMGERPTPANTVQWQPQVDLSDTRLAARVAAWQVDISLEELLAHFSVSSGVPLRASPELNPIRLSAFIQHAALDGTMCSLGEALDAYWAFPRGSVPDSRVYWLVPYDPIGDSLSQWYEKHVAVLQRARAQAYRAEREARLDLYQAALGLSPDELLKQHEKTDPWLCADFLSPVRRPMIEKVCSLTPEQREELLAQGEIQVPVRSLDDDFRKHLGEWAKGRWGRPATAEPAPDPDRLPRFTTPEERWAHATVRFWWSNSALKLFLDVPDVARFDADAIRTDQRSPYGPRKELSALGFRDHSEEYAEAAKAEALEWERSHGGGIPQTMDRRLPYAEAASPPNRTDPRLASALTLGPAPPSAVSLPETLEQIARQHELDIIATYLPPTDASIRLTGDEPLETTIGGALEVLRAQRGGMLTWGFRGNYLIVRDVDYRIVHASRLSPDVLAEWHDLLRSSPLRIDDLATRLAALNEFQVLAIAQLFPQLDSLPLSALQAYGDLGRDQRSLLRSAEGLAFTDLSTAQTKSFAIFARRTHPWLTTEDLSSAVLRTVPRRLSTGQEGMSLVIEYDFPDAPDDRDVVFTAPLLINITE